MNGPLKPLTKKSAVEEIRQWGQLAWQRGLVAGAGGNMSVMLESGAILITCHQASLGFLDSKGVMEVSGRGETSGKGSPSSELPLHLAIYRELPVLAVLHAHPPNVIAFSGSGTQFAPISLEEKFSLGSVPIHDQSQTPTVTDPREVVRLLKRNRIVILKNHGSVAVGRSLMEAFHLTDLLEAALKAQLLRSLIGRGAGPRIQRKKIIPLKDSSPIFSPEHLKALVDRVNQNEEVQRSGRKNHFSTSLGFRVVDGDGSQCWTFRFADGRIMGWEKNANASYVFSAPWEIWELVFRGELDPFVATLQGTITLTKGELKDLSKWYDPCQKVFQVWQTMHPLGNR
jgi:L-fuculose-phosphate aldolase